MPDEKKPDEKPGEGGMSAEDLKALAALDVPATPAADNDDDFEAMLDKKFPAKKGAAPAAPNAPHAAPGKPAAPATPAPPPHSAPAKPKPAHVTADAPARSGGGSGIVIAMALLLLGAGAGVGVWQWQSMKKHDAQMKKVRAAAALLAAPRNALTAVNAVLGDKPDDAVAARANCVAAEAMRRLGDAKKADVLTARAGRHAGKSGGKFCGRFLGK